MAKNNNTLKASWLKTLAVATGFSALYLADQAYILDKYEKALVEYKQPEKRDLVWEVEWAISDYKLETAEWILYLVDNNDSDKKRLSSVIDEKKDSFWYTLNSMKWCVTWQSNWSNLTWMCETAVMFTPFWDVKDLATELWKDWDIDNLTVWLSVLWLAATAATIYSWGLAAPAKTSVWIMKKLHKLELVPKWMRELIMKIKSTNDINPDILKITDKISVLIKNTDLDTAGIMIKNTTNINDLDKMISLTKTYWSHTKTFINIWWDDFIKLHMKYWNSIDIAILKKAANTQDWFKLLLKKWPKGFKKSFKKPVLAATKVRAIKYTEQTIWKIKDLKEFMQNMLMALGTSFALYLSTILLEFKDFVRDNKKKK